MGSDHKDQFVTIPVLPHFVHPTFYIWERNRIRKGKNDQRSTCPFIVGCIDGLVSFLSNCVPKLESQPASLLANNVLDLKIYEESAVGHGVLVEHIVDVPKQEWCFPDSWVPNQNNLRDHIKSLILKNRTFHQCISNTDNQSNKPTFGRLCYFEKFRRDASLTKWALLIIQKPKDTTLGGYLPIELIWNTMAIRNWWYYHF